MVDFQFYNFSSFLFNLLLGRIFIRFLSLLFSPNLSVSCSFLLCSVNCTCSFMAKLTLMLRRHETTMANQSPSRFLFEQGCLFKGQRRCGLLKGRRICIFVDTFFGFAISFFCIVFLLINSYPAVTKISAQRTLFALKRVIKLAAYFSFKRGKNAILRPIRRRDETGLIHFFTLFSF